MKKPTRLMIIAVSAAVLFSVLGVKGASAQTALSAEQQQRISDNCQSIKTTLNQLHTSDALLRVNRGQIYESMSTKFMDRFNARLNSNSLDATATSAVSSSYRTALDNFRTDYIAYERQLAATIKIDCTQKQTEFHDSLEDARTKRNKVHTDITRLNRYIDDYRSAVNDFFINFKRTTEDK